MLMQLLDLWPSLEVAVTRAGSEDLGDGQWYVQQDYLYNLTASVHSLSSSGGGVGESIGVRDRARLAGGGDMGWVMGDVG
jgi:hypothetical protein